MWTKRICSSTIEFPTARLVFHSLLQSLIKHDVYSAWAHFEIIAEGGWFERARDKKTWIEVAYSEGAFLELNLGIPESKRSLIPAIPAKWRQKRDCRLAPKEDVQELVSWLDACLGAVSENPSYQVAGWIDGL